MRRQDDFGTYLTDEHIEIAKSNGIAKSTICTRFYRGMSVEDAITMPTKRKYKKDDAFFDYEKKAIANGIDKRTFRSRTDRGWDMEIASSRPPMTPQEIGRYGNSKRKTVIPRHIMELAKKNGVSYSALKGRVRRWRCLELCATHPPIKPGDRNKGLLERLGYDK